VKRFYYISDNLEDLARVERDMEAEGIARPQMYVLSHDDVGLESQGVNRVASFLKTDVVHSGEIGALIGAVAAAVVIAVSHFSGIAAQVGWPPFLFLAIVALGFSIWLASFIGMQEPNVHFIRFKEALNAGKHVLLVETDKADEDNLKKVLTQYPRLDHAGVETTHTKPLMVFLRQWQRFRRWA